jgi:uncharacterized protein (TIGR03435 family)
MHYVTALLVLAAVVMQDVTTSTPTAGSFEVASVKGDKDSTARPALVQRGPGTFFAENSTARNLIRGAYGVQWFRVVGGPDWIDADRFDITAKLQAADSNGGDEWPRVEAALQRLLIERFGLKVHREMRPMKQLVIRRARGATPLTHRGGSCVSDDASSSPAAVVSLGYCGTIRFTPDGSITGGGISMGSLVGAISSLTGLPTRDETGVTGVFDVALTWVPDDVGATLFTALREQLRLVVSSETKPMEVIVVDDIRRPTQD